MKKVVASLFIITLIAFSGNALAQCTTTISTFPYSENFENNNGNWTSGGAAPSWQWGTINKPVITTAGTGLRGWTTGRVNGGSYNDGEDSWLRSPCFNFASLSNPMISFKIFWETERQYDGASIEYSTNGGSSWSILGSQNSNTNCDGENWFNYSPVRYLGNEPGWSGNVQSSTGSCVGGGGSGTWLTAKHKLNFLAGRNNVRFRFRFGAGTSCNQYDGFAIDDVRIEEIPASPASFGYQCAGINTITFNTPDRICQTGVTWNFGDPASGSQNTSTQLNPTHIFSGPGSYTIRLTADFRNAPTATAQATIVIIEPTVSVTDPISCNGGVGGATVSVSPVDAYTYTWNTSPPQNSNILTGVAAGTYTVNISGSPHGCVNSTSVTLTEPPVLSASLTPVAATCASGTGSIVSNVNGGIAPYTYSWSDGSTSASISNKVPGNYTLTVTDQNGCSISSTAAIAAATNNIQVTSVVTNSSCGNSNGAITITASGGTAPYTYLWNSGETTATLNNITAGSYSVTVRDASGCTFTSPPIAVNDNGASITITPSTTPSQCGNNNGSVSITVSGGSAPYTYSWSNGATTPAITNLTAGTYRVTVTDSNGCNETFGDITVSNANSTISITPQTNPAQCSNSNGSVRVTVTGGSAPYTYLWSNGATTPAITNLAAGTYRVTVTDSNGCSETSGDITVGNATSTISITPQTNPAQCGNSNGSVSVTVTGGSAPYTYSWSNGATTPGVTNLAAGIYRVTVTDSNGCSGSSGDITVSNVNPTIALSFVATPERCGNNNGAISITASGGTSPYRFSWSSGETTQSISNLGAGNYQVVVTDANGCESSPLDVALPNENSVILIQPAITSAKCLEDNGAINLSVSGGTGPYSYTWSNGATSAGISSLPTGIYSVDVVDANGCTGSLANIEVARSNNSLNISLGADRNYCPGMTVTLSPGGQFANYTWQDGSGFSSFSVTRPGTYSVTVSDASGCSGSDSVLIYSNCSDLYFPSAFTPNGDGLNETFGALGDFTGLRDYNLVVYGRWGQEVFRTSDPLKKWDGTYKGKLQGMHSYIWTARYTIGNRLTEVVKGTVILIR